MGYKVVGVGLLLVGDTITGLFEEMTFELKLMKKMRHLCFPNGSWRTKCRLPGPSLDLANKMLGAQESAFSPT